MKEYEIPEITEEIIEVEDIMNESGDVGKDPAGGTFANLFDK